MTHRIAVLGLSHDHIWGNLTELQETGRAELVGAADPDSGLREKYRSRFPGEVTDSAETLLQRGDITAVYVFGSNRESEDYVVAACERGLHVLLEKPMAASLGGAERVIHAAEAAGVRFMINWPFAWWPQLRLGIAMAQAGEIGRLWEVKYRAAHQGPREMGCSPQFSTWLYDAEQNGAGALMDYCCYGAALSSVLLGRPERILGLARSTGLKPDLALEDNAVLLMQYPHALAMSEASWTQVGNLTSYVTVLYGSEATLVIEPYAGGQILCATPGNPDGVALVVPPQPDHLGNASLHFLAAIEDPNLEIHPLLTGRTGYEAQWILEEGLVAAGLK
jgi:predicted dehydrogenase